MRLSTTRTLAARFTATVAAAGLLASSAALGQIEEYRLTLDGTQEVPRVETTGRGEGVVTIDLSTRIMSWEITYENLEGTPIAAHFHGLAFHCANGPVIITTGHISPIVGSQQITMDQIEQIRRGDWYHNLHTDLHPPGEIRGQLEPAPLEDPIPDRVPLSSVRVRLTPIVDGMTAPNVGVAAPGISGRLYVVDQDGIVWNVNLSARTKSVFMDVSDRLVELGIRGPNTFDERGLLGLAFHPDYQNNGLVYTHTSEPRDPNIDPDFSTMPPDVEANHHAIVAEWRVADPSNPDATVDTSQRRILLRIDQPQFNHNGGDLRFGPDGMLYIALGDGGAANDQDVGIDPFNRPVRGHGCRGNGQDIETILGNILRIDPQGNNSANGEYGIPADNPFVSAAGLDEIWAFGLRNPWRFSFDSATGELFCADVGQHWIEEVNIIERGGNYGWNLMEGTFRFVRNGINRSYVAIPDHLPFTDLIDPIAEYQNADDGVAVIGGHVYRGSMNPLLDGLYVFGDWRWVDTGMGRVFHLDADNEIFELDVEGGMTVTLLGFGKDENGELYVLGNPSGLPFGDDGVVFRVDPFTQLSVIGECPGRMGAVVTGATPQGRVAFIAAFGRGNVVIPPGNPCAGTQLGLDQSARLVGMATADTEGKASIRGVVGQSACGRAFLQALDVDTCTPTNVEGL